MSKNKLSKKIPTSKKTTPPKKVPLLPPAKTNKSVQKPGVSQYLTLLQATQKCIERDYEQLRKLFVSIPPKIEKNRAVTQNRLKKAKETQANMQRSLSLMKKKHKATPTAKNKQDCEKYEKRCVETQATVAAYAAELKELAHQLQTCKEMQRAYHLTDKAMQKIKTDLEKQTVMHVKSSEKKKKRTPNAKKVPEGSGQDEEKKRTAGVSLLAG